MTDKQQQAQERRIWLRTISAEFQQQQKMMELTGADYIPTINEFLKAYYQKNAGVTELNTFDQWKEKGYQVRKGEKAFLFWGKPKRRKQQEPANEEQQQEQTTEQQDDFFPVCYLFDISQCRKMD